MNLKRVLIIIAVILVVILTTSLVGLTYFSYHLVETLAEYKNKARPHVVEQAQQQPALTGRTSVNSTEKPIILVAQKTSDFDDMTEKFEQLSLVQSLKEKLKAEQMPSLCEIICDRGDFSARDEKRPVDKLVDYYYREGTKALSDPQFRLAVEQAATVAQIFPESIHDLLVDIKTFTNNVKQKSEVDKLWLSTRITTAFFREAYAMNENLKKVEGYSKALNKITKLRAQCSSVNAVQTARQCQDILKQH